MNMEYKKYTICETLELAITNLSIITSNMVNDGVLEDGHLYDEPIPVTGLFDLGETVKHITGKYYFLTPDPKYMIGTLCDEQTDINPNRTKIEYYKIYDHLNEDNLPRFRDWTKSPHSLDYTTGLNIKLQAEFVFDSLGNVTQVIHYLNAVPDTMGLIYTDPIVKYNATYYYDTDGYVTHREVSRDWMLTNDEWSGVLKSTTKFYTKIQARNVGKRRRQSLVDNLIIGIGFFILITEGLTSVSDAETTAMPFFNDVSESLSRYYESGNKTNSEINTFPLYASVLEHTSSWLDNVIPIQYTGIEGLTIRNYILVKIDVSGAD